MGETEGQRVRGRKEEKQQGEGDERRNAGWSGAEGEREEGEVERQVTRAEVTDGRGRALTCYPLTPQAGPR